MSKTVVIFDLDGTLLDTLDDLSEAVNHALRLRTFPLHTREEYMTMVGNGVRKLVTRALPAEHQDDEALVDAALADFKAYYTAHIDFHTRPYPGIPQLLCQLHRNGVLLAVASNKFQEGAEYLVKKYFPDIPFVAIIGNRPGFPLKPDPAIVAEILHKACVNDQSIFMIGDSPTDMKTAENAHINAIAVSWGYRPMKGTPGLTVVDSPEQIITHIIPPAPIN